MKTQSPKPTAQPRRKAPTVNGPSDEVLTLPEAAAYLRLPEADIIHLAVAEGLPARCISGEWRFLKAAIQDWLATAEPTWEMRKAAILELSGKYKDDPDLEGIVEEALRRRGRRSAKADAAMPPDERPKGR